MPRLCVCAVSLALLLAWEMTARTPKPKALLVLLALGFACSLAANCYFGDAVLRGSAPGQSISLDLGSPPMNWGPGVQHACA